MGLILGILDGVLCVILYARMCRREIPKPMGKKVAIPMALGLLAPILSTALLIVLGFILMQVNGGQGQSLQDVVPTYTLKSLVAAFLSASFPEELIKFLFILLSVKLVKPKNIYEYGLLGSGVGTGFTFLEQMAYGGQSPITALVRMPFFAMHMVFNLIMAIFLGLAMYEKQKGRSGATLHAILAFVVPLLWHTVFDASTVDNTALMVENEATNVTGFIIAAGVMLVSVVMQFVMFAWLKKKTGEYSGMALNWQDPLPVNVLGQEI